MIGDLINTSMNLVDSCEFLAGAQVLQLEALIEASSARLIYDLCTVCNTNFVYETLYSPGELDRAPRPLGVEA